MRKLTLILAILFSTGLLMSGQANSQGNHSAFNEFSYAKPSETQLDSLNVRCIGRALDGECYAVYVQGDYAYVGAGATFLVLDLRATSPRGPSLVGWIHTTCVIEHLHVDGHYAYVAHKFEGLRVIDIADPASPSELGSFEDCRYISDVFATGEYAYITDQLDGLRIIDVSDPLAPHQVGFFATGLHTKGVSAKDNHAYVTVSDHMSIINVSNPSNPYQEGVLQLGASARDIFLVGNYAHLPTSYDFTVADISDPANPSVVGTCYYGLRGERVFVKDNHCYIVASGAGLRIINISDPTEPFLEGSLNTQGSAVDINATCDKAYVADEFCGLAIINVADPVNPYLEANYDTGDLAWDVFVSSSLAFVAYGYHGLHILDTSDPSTPYLLSSFCTRGYAHDVFVVGDYAYVASDTGLEIVNVSDPSRPSEEGVYATPAGAAESVFIHGHLAFVTGGDYLCIVDVLDPFSPYFLSQCSYGGGVLGQVGQAFANDSLAFVPFLRVPWTWDWTSGLSILDISDPLHPHEVGNYTFRGSVGAWGPSSVFVSGDYAYMTFGDTGLGLVVFDVSDCTNPVWVSMYDAGTACQSVYTCGPYAYIAATGLGLFVVDIEDPRSPWEIGFYDTGGSAIGVHVGNERIYVADYTDGIYILEFTPTGTEDGKDSQLPTHFSLSQNYPNPFNVSTKISYSLPVGGYVRLDIFNLLGRKVATLANGQQSAGLKEILWDASDMTSALYFYKLTAGEFSQVKKMMLLK